MRPVPGGLLLLRSFWDPPTHPYPLFAHFFPRLCCPLLTLVQGLEVVGWGKGLAITISCLFQNEDAQNLGSNYTVCRVIFF